MRLPTLVLVGLVWPLLSLLPPAPREVARPAKTWWLPEQHPCLLTTPAGIRTLRHQLQTIPWKTQSWQRLRAEADKFLEQPVDLPPRGGQWNQAYLDSVSGQVLQRGKLVGDWQWEHHNPKTQQIYRGNPARASRDYDGIIIGLLHDTWAVGVLQLGLAYQLSQDRRYATKAREILLAYARLYPTLPVINRSGRLAEGKCGKVHIQSLDEAVWLVDMVQGADLIWPTLSPADRQLLGQQLFSPAVAVIRRNYLGIHNITCWENAAIGLVGVLTRDEALLAFALDDPSRGYQAQVAKGITPDGSWLERAPGYQFYTLHALLTLGQAAANSGYPLDFAPLKKMFDWPLAFASPDLTLPPFNDSHPVSLPTQHFLYEWAYAQYQDPRYAAVLTDTARGAIQTRGPHWLNWALLYGAPALPPAPVRAVTSQNWPATGYARLTQGQGPEQALLYFKYTPHVGWHSHPEQLSFVLYKGGEPVAVDPGINRYGDPAHAAWYKKTFAHNTVVVNERSQRHSTAACLAFGQEKQVDYVMSETRNAYDSVRFVRTAALLSPNLVLIVDQVEARRPLKTVDVAYHQAGRWLDVPPSEAWAPHSGFALQERLLARHQQAVSLATRLPSGRQVRVSVDSQTPVDVRTGIGPSATGAPVASVFFQRPATTSACFAWCIALDGQRVQVAVRPVARPAPAGSATVPVLAVQVRAAHQHWNLLVNPDEVPATTSPGLVPKRFTVH